MAACRSLPELPGVDDSLNYCRTESKNAATKTSGEPTWEVDPHPDRNQVFSICENSSSTGVERPKMVTDTRTLLLS